MQDFHYFLARYARKRTFCVHVLQDQQEIQKSTSKIMGSCLHDPCQNSAWTCKMVWPGKPAIRISLAPHAVLLMPLRGHTGHEMHPRGFTASEKATWKSRPGHLVSSAWCLWIVHECDFRLQAKMDFSICAYKVGFRKFSHNCYTILILNHVMPLN